MLDGPGNRRLGVAELLFGRSSELATITAFVERAGIGGEALLLLGEPGVGKTALLDATASVAAEAGMSVLRAAGAQFEADLPFSGLHQVLLPLLDEFGRLDAVHGGALSAALGYGASPAPDRMLVPAATLAVLRHAAADSPVLVVVDDMPWMDRATARVLGFVARRLAGARVGFLAASRTGEEGFFERDPDASGRMPVAHAHRQEVRAKLRNERADQPGVVDEFESRHPPGHAAEQA